MKKIYTLLCIAATMLAACAKENLVENDATPQDEGVKYIDVTFGAEFPVHAELQDNAKTMLNNDLSVSWSEGDQIAVNNDGWTSAKKNMDLDTFTGVINIEDPHRATFSGKINSNASKFIAMYPATGVKLGSIMNLGVNSDGNVYMVLPNSQTAREGSFTNGCALSYAMGAVSEGNMDVTVEFKNLCALLEFTMPDYVIGAQKVVIKANNGTKMAGGCVIDRSNFTFKSFGPSDKKDATYDYVTVTAPNTASKFYAVIFPGNYASGFNITVTTADGQVYSRNVARALDAQANHIYDLGTLGVVLDEEKVDLAVNIEQNIKTGSIATFNIAANGDFKTMVKSWDISLYNSDDQLVRKIEGNTTGSGTLDVVGDYKLLAAGDYYATVTYFMQTGSKRDALSFTGIKAQPFKVEGVVINATPTLNYDGGPLNGTDVQLSFDTSAVDPDLAKLINWTDITLTDENRVTYRTATAAGKMTPAAGKPYLPNGDYTLTAYFTLPELGSYTPTALDPKTITVNLTPTFGVELTSAKTSYDYYKAGGADNINKANDCHNMGIYELAANVTGISDAVATQMGINYIWYLDNQNIGTSDGQGTRVSGINMNTTGAKSVSFGNKNVKCQANFDTVTKDSGNIAVDITGLPYNKNKEKAYNFKNDWSWTKNGEWKDNEYLNWYLATVNFKGFYIPASINATVNYHFQNYSGSSFHTYLKCYAGNTQFLDVDNQATSKWYDYEGSATNITFSESQNTIKCENSAKSSLASGAVATARLYYLGVVYR